MADQTKKSQKKKGSASARNVTPTKTKRAPLSKKAKIAILSVALSLVVIAGAVLGTVLYLNNRPFDYYKEDITKYISLDLDAYKDFEITMKLDAITDTEVDERIWQLLNANKPDTALNSGKADRNQPIQIGDVVTIFYRGFYYDENDARVEFDGGCNIEYSSGSVTPTTLTIGSGSFFSGFESSLLGVIPDEYSKITVTKDGLIEEGDVIYVQMSSILPGNQSFNNKTVRIDLSNPDLEKTWGVGVADFFVGKELRQLYNSYQTTLPEEVEGQTEVYYFNIKPLFKTSGEENPVVVTTYCPITHTEETLAGKTLYFDVYIDGVVHYDTPALTESFIYDTLKLTQEELSAYEGEDVIEKFRGYIRAQLMEGYYNDSTYMSGYDALYDAYLEEIIWEKLGELTEIIRIPKRAIEPFYDAYIASLVEEYELYKDYYGYSSAEEYICDAMGTTSIEEADELIWYNCANAAKEKMVVYLIAKNEGILEQEDMLSERADALFDEVMDYYIKGTYAAKFEACKTDEEYQALYEELAATLREDYTDEYLMENAVYEAVFDRLLTYPRVTVIGRGQE